MIHVYYNPSFVVSITQQQSQYNRVSDNLLDVLSRRTNMTLPKWLYLVQLLAPAILNSFGVPTELVGAIADGIGEAEAIPDATGADKKAHVLSLVGDAVVAVNAAKGKQVLDPVRIPVIAGSAIDLVVEAVDLVHDRTTDPNQLNAPAPPASVPATTRETPAPAASAPASAPPAAAAQDEAQSQEKAEHAPPPAPVHPASTDHKGNAGKRGKKEKPSKH